MIVSNSDHAVLDAQWHQAFHALRAAGLEAEADHPIAATYRAASDAVNHANRSRDYAIFTGRIPSGDTPGYNCRLRIWFETDGKGRKIAYRWGRSSLRAFRMPLAQAELLVATEQADEIECHPIRGRKAATGERAS